MDEYRPRRSPASGRFIGMFSSPSPSSSPTEPSFVAGDEFHEDDFLFSASPAASSDAPPDAPRSPSRVPQGHLGLLAALHEGDKRLLVRRGSAVGGGGGATAAAATAGTLLRRKETIAAAASAASGSSLSPTKSLNSAARAIPATPRPKNAGPAAPYHQSAPVKVPVRPPLKPVMGRWDDLDDDLWHGDAAMLPAHEMVA